MEAICEVTMLYDPGIRDRLAKIFEDLDISVEEVAKASDVPMSTLYNFLSEDRRVKSIKDTHLAAIIRAYPSINANYVLTGMGTSQLIPPTDLSQLTEDAQMAFEANRRLLEKLGNRQ